MSNKVVNIRKNNELSSYYSEEQINLIKASLSDQKLTEIEFKLFLYTAMNVDLDPLQRQIYAIKRGDKMSIQTAIDGFRLIAERTGKYSPGKDSEFLYDKNKSLIGAKVYVKKLTPDGTWHDISAMALLKEYIAFGPLWKKMPHVMIEKCAEARCLRRAFPADLSGLYAKEEMDQADNKDPSISYISKDLVDKLNNLASKHSDSKRLIAHIKKSFKINSIHEIIPTDYNTIFNWIEKMISSENVDKQNLGTEKDTIIKASYG